MSTYYERAKAWLDDDSDVDSDTIKTTIDNLKAKHKAFLAEKKQKEAIDLQNTINLLLGEIGQKAESETTDEFPPELVSIDLDYDVLVDHWSTATPGLSEKDRADALKDLKSHPAVKVGSSI